MQKKKKSKQVESKIESKKKDDGWLSFKPLRERLLATADITLKALGGNENSSMKAAERS